MALPTAGFLSKVVHVKGKFVLKLNDRQRLLSCQSAILDVLKTKKEVVDEIKAMRKECTSAEEWGHKYEELFMKNCCPIMERHGGDVEWFMGMSEHLCEEGDEEVGKRGAEIGELGEFGTLGPLAVTRGTCVELKSLTGADAKRNGEKGVIKSFDKSTGTYEVALVPEKVLDLKPSFIKVLDDQEKLVSAQLQLLEAIDTPAMRAKIEKASADSSDKEKFEEAMEELVGVVRKPIYDRHGVNGEWMEHVAGHLAEEGDKAVAFRAKRLAMLTGCLDIPAMPPVDPGCHLIVAGLVGSEGKQLNGQVVIVDHWDGSKSCYTVRLADDLNSTKEIKRHNLRYIPPRDFENEKDALSFLDKHKQAWATQVFKDDLDRIKAMNLPPQEHGMWLRELLLKVQRPSLEKWGFRLDHGGVFQANVALGEMEKDSEALKKKKIEEEVFLGFPRREE